MSDLFLIIITAFAVIGLFYLFDVVSACSLKKYLPKTITVMLYSEDDMTYQKYKSLIYNVYNNDIVLIGDTDKCMYSDAKVISKQLVGEYITNNLFTK